MSVLPIKVITLVVSVGVILLWQFDYPLDPWISIFCLSGVSDHIWSSLAHRFAGKLGGGLLTENCTAQGATEILATVISKAVKSCKQVTSERRQMTSLYAASTVSTR